jgi:hypothetical protein
MARGWESKSVEQQQELASSDVREKGRRLTPEEASRTREKQSLQLSRARVLDQLAHATSPTRRSMLEQALADLDCRLAHLG